LEVQSDDLCSQPALNHVFAVGEETRNLEQVYIESGDGCILDSQAPSTNYKSVGDELPASQFAHLTVQEAECGPALQSGTRLRALYFADEHGGKLEGFFVDSKFDAVCSYFDAADGVSRCLPGGARYGGYYLDAECTHEAGAISVCEARTSTGPLLAGFRQDFAWVSLPPLDDCSLPRAQVHPLLGSGQAAGYLRDAAGDCNPVNQPDLTFYELGPAFDPSEFVARNAER
jgi:hypothetical protein